MSMQSGELMVRSLYVVDNKERSKYRLRSCTCTCTDSDSIPTIERPQPEPSGWKCSKHMYVHIEPYSRDGHILHGA